MSWLACLTSNIILSSVNLSSYNVLSFIPGINLVILLCTLSIKLYPSLRLAYILRGWHNPSGVSPRIYNIYNFKAHVFKIIKVNQLRLNDSDHTILAFFSLISAHCLLNFIAVLTYTPRPFPSFLLCKLLSSMTRICTLGCCVQSVTPSFYTH